MDINISDANQFISLHAHPQTVSSNDLSLINNWIEKYPYCQSLRFLAAQATKSAEETENYLAKAAAFASNREALFQFINHVDNFETENVVLDESLNAPNEILEVIEPRNDMGQAFGADLNYYKVDEAKADAEEYNEDTLVLEATQTEEEEPVQETENVEETATEEIVEEQISEEPVQEIKNVGENVADEIVEEPIEEEEIHTKNPVEETENDETVAERIAEEPVAEETVQSEEPVQQTKNIEETAVEELVEEPIIEEKIQTEEPVQQTENIKETVADEIVEEPTTQEETYTEEPVQEIETVVEETAEEPIAEKETHTEEPAQEIEPVEEAVAEEKIEESIAEEEPHTEEPIQEVATIEETVVEEMVEQPTEKDELIFESPVASDFFAFAKAEKPEPLISASAQPKEEEKPQINIKEDISQYNDERLPYTFLWWLNKTRKEYASNTQPYVKANKPASMKKEAPLEQSLNHQIAENIFHLRGADEIGGNNMQNQTVPFDFRRKEFQIIEKFIKEEPQIKPPAANKIDTENKAKKSSEDANQVVSETLAKIYVEQMLYHKALDVYKKLSLKYPEKSTYFASQIKYLELKVN